MITCIRASVPSLNTIRSSRVRGRGRYGMGRVYLNEEYNDDISLFYVCELHIAVNIGRRLLLHRERLGLSLSRCILAHLIK